MFLCTTRKLENGLWQKLSSITEYLVGEHTPEFLPEFLTTVNWRNISRKAAAVTRHAMLGTHSHQETQKSILTSLAFKYFEYPDDPDLTTWPTNL